MIHTRKSILMLSLVLCVVASPVFAQGIFTGQADWNANDGTKQAGSASFTNGVYELQGNGNDIWGATDEGFYLFTEKTGSWSLTGKYTWVDPGTNDWAKFGPMIRENAQNAQAVNYMGAMRGGPAAPDFISPQWRDTAATNSAGHDPRVRGADNTYIAPVGGEIWMRLSRNADLNLIVLEWSHDGQTWQVGHARLFPMAASVAYGIAITNHDANTYLAVGEASNVTLTEYQAKTIGIRSFPNGAYAFVGKPANVDINVYMASAGKVTETVPDGWTVSNISDGGTLNGNTISWDITASTTKVSYQVAPAADLQRDETNLTFFYGEALGGKVSGPENIEVVFKGVGIFDYQKSFGDANDNMAGLLPELNGNTYSIYGSGSDIWGTGDNFHFLFKKVSGPFVISGVDGLIFQENGEATWVKGGFMVRADLDNNSVNAFAMMRTDMEYRMQYRLTKGGESGNGSSAVATLHNGNIELQRIGDSVSAIYTNAEGKKVVLSTTNITLPNEVWVGLAITSHANDGFSSMEMSNVQLKELSSFATRVLPSKALPVGGGKIEGVKVTASIVEGKTSSDTITETLPAGFSAQNIQASNGSASFAGGTITWKLSGATGTATMTYDLVIADVPKSAYFLTGEVNGITTGGDSTIVPITFTAPFNANASVTLDGIIGAEEYAGGYTETFFHDSVDDKTPPGVNIDGEAYPQADNNVTFHITHNNQYIWVGVDVVDSDVAFDENATEAWNNDSVEFYFDGNLSRLGTKEGGALGFQATVVGSGRLVGGNNAPTAIQGNGYVYSEGANYWNFATRAKSDQKGWITEYQLDKAQVLSPLTNTVCGIDFKMNGSKPGAATRTSNWGYWMTDFDGQVLDAFWNNETGWAVIDLGTGFSDVSDWSLF